jgi:tetratricopeptide (TPR) repeat protein
MTSLRQILPKIVMVGLNVSGFAVCQAQSVMESEIPSPHESREEKLIEGMDRGIKQDYRGAIAIFSELIQRYPDYADAYFNRGIARTKLQDYRGAIADQTKAVTFNPQLAEAYQARAEIYWQLGDRQKAKEDLQRAITLFKLHQNTISQHQAEQLINQWQRK